MGSMSNETLVVHSYELCASVALVYFPGRTGCRSKICGQVGVYVIWECTFLYQRLQNLGVKSLCSHPHNFSMFSKLCGCCFSNGTLLQVCEEQPIVWGFPRDPFGQQLIKQYVIIIYLITNTYVPFGDYGLSDKN